MSLPVWQATIVNEFGEIIPSPTMTIIDEATGLGLTVYSDVNGATPLGTDGVFTGGTDGFAQFFAPTGRYSIKAENLGAGFERTFRFVALTAVGTGAGEVPLNSDLGTASLVDTGLLTGNVPTADQLSMVGETVNYTGANLNIGISGADAASDDVAVGFADGTTSAVFFLTTLGFSSATSITVDGTFNVARVNTGLVASGLTPVLNTRGSHKLTKLSVTGLSGLVDKEPLTLRTDLATSKITVNT